MSGARDSRRSRHPSSGPAGLRPVGGKHFGGRAVPIEVSVLEPENTVEIHQEIQIVARHDDGLPQPLQVVRESEAVGEIEAREGFVEEDEARFEGQVPR